VIPISGAISIEIAILLVSFSDFLEAEIFVFPEHHNFLTDLLRLPAEHKFPLVNSVAKWGIVVTIVFRIGHATFPWKHKAVFFESIDDPRF